MITTISHISIIVQNQDQALDFYVNKLGFELHTDANFGEFRWLTICPPGNKNFEIALLPARTDAQKAVVGKQTPEYPLCSFAVEDCKKMYEELSARGVEFVQAPSEKPWGVDAMCKDLYGNLLHINQCI